MIFVTGDTHGSYRRLRRFFRDKAVSEDDTLIILGDTGLNYYNDERDSPHKNAAARLPLTLLCLRGNHDRRPETMADYRTQNCFGGMVYVADAYPRILFMGDGQIYRIEGRSFLAIGGAYSIDKEWRLRQGHNWFTDEQLDLREMRVIEAKLQAERWQADIVLSHTCPLRFEPAEALFAGVDQSRVDKSMEWWLDSIEQRLRYRQWFCGHFHIDKQIDRLRFVYDDVVTL